jgi:hypothetical protein
MFRKSTAQLLSVPSGHFESRVHCSVVASINSGAAAVSIGARHDTTQRSHYLPELDYPLITIESPD